MSLADKEWLTPRDVASVLGWSVTKARRAIRAGTFTRVRVSVDSQDRPTDEVHRDEIVAYVTTKQGGRHGKL